MSDLTQLFTWTCPRCSGLTAVLLLVVTFSISIRFSFFQNWTDKSLCGNRDLTL